MSKDIYRVTMPGGPKSYVHNATSSSDAVKKYRDRYSCKIWREEDKLGIEAKPLADGETRTPQKHMTGIYLYDIGYTEPAEPKSKKRETQAA